MLTPEQIKNLKPGDQLVVQGIFSEVYADGDIVMQIVQKYKDKIEHDFRFFDPYSVSLPPEIVNSQSTIVNKYDPTRLFRKGDKVRVVKCKGRNYTGQTTGEIGIVDRDESPGTASVEVEFADEDMWEIDPAYLELVTPVEELEPYSVVDAHTHWEVADKDMKTVSTYSKLHHPNAKSAAEAERDRLNAEWRKEQK